MKASKGVRRLMLAALGPVAVAVLAAGCGGDNGEGAEQDAVPSGSFVAETDDREFLVGVVVGDEGHVSAYACNGARGVSEWFHGRVAAGEAELVSARGAELNVTIGDDGVSGSFVAPILHAGAPTPRAPTSRFVAATGEVADGRLAQDVGPSAFTGKGAASPSQGVFRASRSFDGRIVQAGWVQLRGGSAIVPGVELQSDPGVTPVAGAPLDVETLTADVGRAFGIEVGELRATRLVADSAGTGEIDVDEAPFTLDEESG